MQQSHNNESIDTAKHILDEVLRDIIREGLTSLIQYSGTSNNNYYDKEYTATPEIYSEGVPIDELDIDKLLNPPKVSFEDHIKNFNNIKKRIKNLVRKMKMNSKYNMNNKIYKICLTIVNILILKKGDDVIIDIIDGIVKIERNIDDDDYIRIINKMLNEFERNKDNIYFLFKILDEIVKIDVLKIKADTEKELFEKTIDEIIAIIK